MAFYSKKPRLGVNIDHVATLRRLRDTPYPNLITAAEEVIAGGADQITVHLREDRRHIIDSDVIDLKKTISVDLNLEMAASDEMLAFALKLKPHSICIVPEKREERTTEGGLDLKDSQRRQYIQSLCQQAKAAGILVSLFIEPDTNDISVAKELGAQAIELHTGSLCIAHQSEPQTAAHQQLTQEWQRVHASINRGHELGLMVHVGHGIDYDIAPELAKIPHILEYNIGHSLICHSVFVGLREATRLMRKALNI